MSETTLIALSLVVFGWSVGSEWFAQRNLSGPLLFLGAGLLLANPSWGLVSVDVESATVHHLAEITLALLLFADASAVPLAAARRDLHLTARLLGIGLPLTVALGIGVALVVFPSLPLALAGLIAASLAPTDAALERVGDRRRPPSDASATGAERRERIERRHRHPRRDVLHRVSGDGSRRGRSHLRQRHRSTRGARHRHRNRRSPRAGRRSSPTHRPRSGLDEPRLPPPGHPRAGGHGIPDRFRARRQPVRRRVHRRSGLRRIGPRRRRRSVELTELTGSLLSLVLWFIFGAGFVIPAFEEIDLRTALYAVLSLTVVRMLPVAISLIGSGCDRATTAFIGWFGPRGLASVVFALLAVEELGAPRGELTIAVNTIAITIVFSVLAHGVTARPFASRYLEAVAPEGRATTP